MKRLVEFPLEDGTSILAEVDVLEAEGGMVRAARADELVEKAQETFETAMEKIQPIAAGMIAKLGDLRTPAETIEVEFGIKLSASAGAILACAATEANFKVVLTWKRPA